MKKLIAILLCLAMFISLTACANIESSPMDTADENEDDNSIETTEAVEEEPTLSPEYLEGKWVSEITLDDFAYANEGMTFNELMLDYMTDEADDSFEMGSFEYNETCNIYFTIEFENEDDVKTSCDFNEMNEYITDYFNAIFDYLASPEFMIDNSDLTMEEFESYLATQGMTVDDYSETMKDAMMAEVGDIEELSEEFTEMFADSDLESIGKYSIDEDKVLITDEDDETVLVFADETLILSSEDEDVDLELVFVKAE